MKSNLLNIMKAIVILTLGFSTRSAAQAGNKNQCFQKEKKVFKPVLKVENEILFQPDLKTTTAYSFETTVLKIVQPVANEVMLLQTQIINIENEGGQADQENAYPLNEGIKKPFFNYSFMVESTLRQAISHSTFVLY